MSGVSPRLRGTLRWTAAALAAGATLLYVVLWMVATRYESAVELGYDSTYLAGEQAQLITAILPGSPAEQAGIRAGDRITAIEGRPLSDVSYQVREWGRFRPGGRVVLTLTGADGSRRVVTATFRRRVPRPSTAGVAGAVFTQILSVYPVPFVCVGLAVLFLRLDDKRAWLLFAVLAGFAATPAFPENLGAFAPALRPFTLVYQGVMLGMFAPAFYLFFAIFPVRSPLERRLPWLKWVAIVTGVPVAVASVGAGAVRLPEPAPSWFGEIRSAQLAVWWLLALLTLGLVSLIGNFAASTDAQARRRIRVMAWGTLAALIPNVVVVAVTNSLGRADPPWLAGVRAAFAFLLPLSLAYAVVKHRVLEIPVLLRRGARYVLVLRGFTVLLVAVSVGTTLGLSAWLAPALAPLGGAGQATGIATGAAIGTLVLWGGWLIHRRVSGRIDRAFFRQAYDARGLLQDLADKAARVTDRSALAAVLHHHAVDALQPDAAAVYLRDRDGHVVIEAGSWPDAPDRLPPSWPWLSEGPGAGAEHLVRIEGRDHQLLGLLALGPRRSEEPYSREDTTLLAVVANQAALTLENLSMAEEMASRLDAQRRLEYELSIAKEVQQLLLPQRMPEVAGLDFAGTCTQARVVGGDYFDFLDLGPRHLGLVIADVSGKGIAAALLMANLQAMVRSHASTMVVDLGAALRAVNTLFHASTAPNRFATMCVVHYDDEAGSIVYANGGHNPPLLVRADGAEEWLAPTAVALGFFGEWTCETRTRRLDAGDVLVMYSDGITEAWSDGGEEYGEARLLAAVRANRHRPVPDMVQRIMDDVTRFNGAAQADDWTLIVARVRNV